MSFEDFGDDFFDIRDVIEKFEELESEREGLVLNIEQAREELASNPADEAEALRSVLAEAEEALAQFDEDPDLGGLFVSIKTFLEAVKGYGGDHQWRGDWYPVTFVRASYFEEYAQEYAEETGDPEMRNARWPYNCIDWEEAAKQLKQDFSCVDCGPNKIEYWYR